jgi:hypothetical protein
MIDKLTISFILIVYNNREKFFTRMDRDILPTVAYYPNCKFQFVIIDNSYEESKSIEKFLIEKHINYVYKWNDNNIKYGPSINLALEFCCYEYVVYICTNHGKMYDVGWLYDLISPLITNSKIGMTGTVYDGGDSNAFGFPRVSGHHIQGGIFGSRKEILKRYPYSNKRSIHDGSDLYESFQLANAGFILKDIPTIKAVWNLIVNQPYKWKYVHDYSNS